MRVVCDNCGAVYKIADSKLSKEVNKATCKRCGHKIVIYKPGSARAAAAAARPSEAEERTVIKSVEGLDKVGASTGKVPAIGSLTAELRAISLPGVQPVAPPRPASLSPATGASPPVPPLPPRVGPPGIPPKDAPATAVYHGPRPDLPPLPKKPGVPPAPPSNEDDATRPMSRPPPAVVPQMPLPPAKHGAPRSPAPSKPGMRPGGAPSTGNLPAVPTVPPMTAPAPPKKGQPASSIIPPELQTGQHDALAAAATAAAAAPAPASASGSSELGVIAGLGALGLFGVGATLAAPPVSTLGIALAGFAATACLFLPILSQRGRKAGQAGIALFLGLLVGSALGFLAHTRAGATPEPADSLGGIPLEDPSPAAPEPVADPAAPGETAPEAASAEPATPNDGLTAAEREEARKFSDEEPTAAPEPTPAPVREPEPTPAPRKVEQPTPAPKKEEPTPRGLTRPNKPVGPGAPPEEKSTGGSSAGPSPFVIDTIIRNNANINRCFTLEKARGTDISGKIYLKFSIAPDGGVSRARITTSRFAGTALDQCVSKEVNQLNFPPFDGDTQQVRYPFTVL
ncbi:MAG: zinc-ribbon domain-containing protein [Deltaproteobacteria bacterium]|nr:zinc-ribbon domain-containing protein [Deltaproteobacteria bacterium]